MPFGDTPSRILEQLGTSRARDALRQPSRGVVDAFGYKIFPRRVKK
jgi:hypothetical protein